MKTALLALLAISTFAVALPASADMMHHHHRHQVCTMHHHHRVCSWR